MKELGRYDTELQMFVEPPRDSSMNHLIFMRGLMEQGKFGRQPLSQPRGDNIFRLTDSQIKDYAMKEADKRGMALAAPQSQYEQQH